MTNKYQSKLSHRKKYLQVALNSSIGDALAVIAQLPAHERIIIEAGTPLIKTYGQSAISQIYQAWASRLSGTGILPYVVADLKTIDRAKTEVELAKNAGASAAIASGQAPIETLNSFITSCVEMQMDAMIDMMNVEYPLAILRQLKKQPQVVILHRGVDEELFNKQKQIPLHEIRRIKGAYDIMISIAGGDTLREVQRSIFNDADIVIIWKSVYQKNDQTLSLVEGFLKEIR